MKTHEKIETSRGEENVRCRNTTEFTAKRSAHFVVVDGLDERQLERSYVPNETNGPFARNPLLGDF